jgi:hypothetical protein
MSEQEYVRKLYELRATVLDARDKIAIAALNTIIPEMKNTEADGCKHKRRGGPVNGFTWCYDCGQTANV